jgi:tetratricopeptide (TPR) repeat protein
VYFTKANIGIEQDEAVKNAVQNAERALELDPDCAEAEVVLGVSHGSFFGELRVGLEHLQRARQLDPNNPDAVFWLLIWSLTLGWMDQARELAELIVPLDPLSGLSYNAKADYLMFVGDFGLAADFHKLCFDMLPDSPLFLAFYAWGLAFAGRIDELGTALEGGIPEDPSGMTRMAFLFEAAANKDQQKVLSLISTDLEHYCHRDPWWSYFLSTILANVSERDRALGWLERAVDLGFINFPFLANTDPFLANLREEPPFQAIMERVKHEWENSEV